MEQTLKADVALLHKEAMTKPVSELARFLQETLTRRLTAYIVGVREGKTVARWASGEIGVIREHGVEARLRNTYYIASLLRTEWEPQTIRAWFIGMNPDLDDEAPADALREGRFKDVFAAARSFVE